ncbi:ATP-dependent sacrificial sulfur transferase LarE [Candidatus Omnitrophota bacterium]
MAKTTLDKFNTLKKILSKMESIVIAYSGGVDSSLLLKVANDVLSDRALAVTAESETYAKGEFRQAKKIAKKINARQVIIKTDELKDSRFASNPMNHCYYCKKELFGRLKKIARKQGIAHVIDGSNADDRKDFRPGRKAKAELGVRSPLQEAGLTKKDIRMISKKLGLAIWDKPNVACLASRFPFGMEITKKNLRTVEKGETILHNLGIRQVRIRHYGNVARIEVAPKELSRLFSLRSKVVEKLKKLGYNYITLDLEGYGVRKPQEVKNFTWKP